MKKQIRKARKRTTFEFSAEPGSHVNVVGSFNNWDPEAHPLKENPDSGFFTRTMLLPKGRYEYKFVVNGKWTEDPNGSAKIPNDMGSYNSVLDLQQP